VVIDDECRRWQCNIASKSQRRARRCHLRQTQAKRSERFYGDVRGDDARLECQTLRFLLSRTCESLLSRSGGLYVMSCLPVSYVFIAERSQGYARAINPRVQAHEAWSWRMTSPAILAHAIRTQGWGFIPNQVLPPLLANTLVGAILYTSYLNMCVCP